MFQLNPHCIRPLDEDVDDEGGGAYAHRTHPRSLIERGQDGIGRWVLAEPWVCTGQRCFTIVRHGGAERVELRMLPEQFLGDREDEVEEPIEVV